MRRFDHIKEINKSKLNRLVYIEEITKIDLYHGKDGRFTTANGAASFSCSPGKSRAHDLADLPGVFLYA